MDIVSQLRATLLDKDNMPRMKSERWLPVGLAQEAADEIERLRAALKPFAELAGKLESAHNLIGLLTEDDFKRASDALADKSEG